jgi:hypothetical protein
MFKEPEHFWKGFKKIYCICAIKKGFQICKFLKLFANEGSWHLTDGTMFSSNIVTAIRTVFQIRIQLFNRIRVRNLDPDPGRSNLSPIKKKN